MRRVGSAALARCGQVADPVADEDLQLALRIWHELHYRGFDGVAPEREWGLGVLGLRGELEHVFLAALRADVCVPPGRVCVRVPERLTALIEADGGRHAAGGTQRRGR